jgi:hypothetical protein
VVLAGFTTAGQVRINLTCLGARPPTALITEARAIMAAVQARLDDSGEVFLDEKADTTR